MSPSTRAGYCISRRTWEATSSRKRPAALAMEAPLHVGQREQHVSICPDPLRLELLERQFASSLSVASYGPTPAPGDEGRGIGPRRQVHSGSPRTLQPKWPGQMTSGLSSDPRAAMCTSEDSRPRLRPGPSPFRHKRSRNHRFRSMDGRSTRYVCAARPQLGDKWGTAATTRRRASPTATYRGA